MTQNNTKGPAAIEAMFQRREQLQSRRAQKSARIEALHTEIDQIDRDIQANDFAVEKEIGRGSQNNFVFNAPGFVKSDEKE